MKEWQEELEVTQDGMHERRKARWKDWKRKEEKRGGFLCSLLLSGEVFESAALFKDSLGELLEHSVHVGALPRPQPLQEADVAAVTRDEQRQVGILLHHLHWDGCGGKEREGDAPWAFAVDGRKSKRRGGWELTVRRGEDIVGSVQAQHWHLHRLQPVARTGIVVVVVVGGVAEHDGGEALVKFPDGLCLRVEREKRLREAACFH